MGTLESDSDGVMRFAYDPHWLETGFAISHSLPLQQGPHGQAAHRYFANVLPEGNVRDLLCKRLGLSADNDFGLLEAIGGECAGALTLLSADRPAGWDDDYKVVSQTELLKLFETNSLSAISTKWKTRLSLAGAQDKLPILIRDGEYLLPLGNSVSSHILKFPNRDFRHLPANEVLITTIARETGLSVVEAVLHPLGEQGVCVVERYDRVREGEQLTRVHQEDLCQALGISSRQKYESEGGPGFSQCYRLISETSSRALVDGPQLIKWAVFNAAVFNADAHGKNLSFLVTADGRQLAPFYDLVCTRAYERLDEALAMKLGTTNVPTELLKSDWEALAGELGLSPKYIVNFVRDTLERLDAAVTPAVATFKELYGESPAIQMSVPKIRKQIRRLRKLAT